MGDMRVFSESEGRLIGSRRLWLVRNVSDACGCNRTEFLVSVFHDLSRTNKKQPRCGCAEGILDTSDVGGRVGLAISGLHV